MRASTWLPWLSIFSLSLGLACFKVGDAGDDVAETSECPVASQGCPCTEGGSCDAGLVCSDAQLCEPEAGTEESSSGESSSEDTMSSEVDTVFSEVDSGPAEESSSTTEGGPSCGWDPMNAYYDCGFSGEDPDYPIECPEGLVEGAPCDEFMLTGEGCCDAEGNNWYCGVGMNDENYVVFTECG